MTTGVAAKVAFLVEASQTTGNEEDDGLVEIDGPSDGDVDADVNGVTE
jgi:hypothetical protein